MRKDSSHFLVCSILTACLVAASGEPLAGQAKSVTETCSDPSDVVAATLSRRIGPAAADVVNMFSASGASEVTEHVLTPMELKTLDLALTRLPLMHRDILLRHLRRMSFLDLRQGAGSALTSKVDDESSIIFDITLRASLLSESLSSFLNQKKSASLKMTGRTLSASMMLEIATP